MLYEVITEHGERLGAPGLDPQLVTVLEGAHVELAGGGELPRRAVYRIVVEGDGPEVARQWQTLAAVEP